MTDTQAAQAAPAAQLAAALAAVQAELPEIKKTRTAKVEKDGRLLYTYDYADLADVSIAILPILGKHGLAFTSIPGHWEDGKFGLRYYLLHSSGHSIEGFYEISEQGGMQMVGGRITYARRYCLCAVTGVAAEEDVDASDDYAGNGRRMQRRQQPPAGRGEQQPQHTARRARTQNASPAETAEPPAPPQRSAGEALPPLPGEEEPAPVVQDKTAPQNPATGAAPDDTDYDTPGTITERQLTAIWTSLTKNFSFQSDERDQARGVCARITRRKLESSSDLSFNDGKAILDTLGTVHQAAQKEGSQPRPALMAFLHSLDKHAEAPAATSPAAGAEGSAR